LLGNENMSWVDSFSEHEGVRISPRALAPSPDRRVLRKIREYDRNLDVEWSLHLQRWVVTTRNLRKLDKREMVMVVQNEDRSYRALDDRILVNLKLADAFRYDDIAHFQQILNENDRAVDKKMADDLSDEFRARNELLYRARFGYNSIPVGIDL
jgi:hypothetical protein